MHQRAGVALAQVLGDQDEWGVWVNRLSGSGLRPWGLVKTILSGWPEACCMYLGIQKVLDGQQQQGGGSDSSGLLRLGWLCWWPSGTDCTRETWFKFYLVGNATDLT